MDLGKLNQISDRRTCKVCGATFTFQPATKESQELSVLAQFADHLTIHQPTPTQWATAHERIQSGRENHAG